MNNRLYTHGEIIVIKDNLKEIEKNLGHPIPGGIIDLSNLKSRTLRSGEIHTICENIRSIEKNHKHYRSHTGDNNLSLSDILGGTLLMVVISIIFNLLF